jgi:hypothetical protein
VHDLFLCAVVLAMIDDKRVHLTNKRVDGNRECLTIQTIGADVFEIMRPPISNMVESELINHVRAIIAEHSGEWQGACGKPRPLLSEDEATGPRYDETVGLLKLLKL